MTTLVAETAIKNGPSCDAEQMYMRDIEGVSLLTAADEIELGRKVQKGDQAARKRMIEANLRLVVKMARRYHVPTMTLMDLIEEGNIGLMHAVEKFDPEQGFRFSTYASWWIRHEIERAIMNQSRTVRLPVHVVRELNKYKKAGYELVQSMQKEPSYADIAESTDSSVEQVSKLMDYNRGSTSVNEPLYGSDDDGDSFTMLDAVANDGAEDPAAETQSNQVAGQVNDWLELLSKKQRDVIVRRFGLRGHSPQTLERVAEDVDLTRERVRQIQIQALAKLKSVLVRSGHTIDDFTRVASAA